MNKWSDDEADDLLDELMKHDEMEEDFSFGEKKSRSAKTGRRAKHEPAVVDPDPVPDDTAAEDLDVGEETKAVSGPPKPSKRVSGWGADSAGVGRRRPLDADDDDDERLRPRSPSKDDDSDDDIPVIPELEETQEDDLTTQIAVAPTVAVNRVATYKELDTDLMKHAAFLTLDNEIDLKLLSKGLSAEADVQEEDVTWDWDRLFTEVSSELQAEWEHPEKADDEKTV